VAHHVPGRLRLKFDPAVQKNSAALSYLSSLMQSAPDTGLYHVRLNALARSLVLEYDSTRVSPADLQEFLTSRDESRVRELAPAIAGVLGITL
jgi:hypothetical protein